MAESKQGSRTRHFPGFFPHPFLRPLGQAKAPKGEGYPLPHHLHPEFSVYVWRFPRKVFCVRRDCAGESIGLGAAPRLRSRAADGPARHQPRTRGRSLTAPCLPSHPFEGFPDQQSLLHLPLLQPQGRLIPPNAEGSLGDGGSGSHP